MSKTKKYVQISEAADLLGVSVDTIRRWDKAGKITSYRLDNKNRFFLVDDLLTLKSKKEQSFSTIEAAGLLDISASTLLRYEKEAGITIPRNEKGSRIYTHETLQQIQNYKNTPAKKVQETSFQPTSSTDSLENGQLLSEEVTQHTDRNQSNAESTPVSYYEKDKEISESISFEEENTPISPNLSHTSYLDVTSTSEINSKISFLLTTLKHLKKLKDTYTLSLLSSLLKINKSKTTDITTNHFLSPAKTSISPKKVLAFALPTLAILTLFVTVSNYKATGTTIKQRINFSGEKVLAEATEKIEGLLTINIPTIIKNALTVDGTSRFNADIQVDNANLTITNGQITAPNLIYSITGTGGVTITGGQNALISFDGATSIDGASGALTLGSGLSINGLTLANTDTGSAQKIFKTIKVDSTTFDAGSNTDTLTFAAGDNITLTTSTDDKKITISGLSASKTTGWAQSSSYVYLTNSSNFVGIGTSTPSYPLHVLGKAYISDTLTLGSTFSVAGLSTLSGINNSSGGITNAGAITGATGLTSSGTITFSGLSTGVVFSDLAGVLTSQALNLASGSAYITGVLPTTNGGTGVQTYAKGDLLYATDTNTLGVLGLGGAGQVLTASSSGLPVWASVSGSDGLCSTCVVLNPGSTQTITPTNASATGLVVSQASGGTADIFKVTDNSGGDSYFRVDKDGNVVLGNGGLSTGPFTINPPNSDPIAISPAAQGATAYTGTITSQTLTADRTWTFPDATGTICLSTGNCSGEGTNLGGSGENGYLTMWQGQYALGKSVLYDNGNIGIGTTNPTYSLDVAGTARFLGNTVVGGTFDATGAAKLASTLQVSGAASFLDTFNVTGATQLSSTLGVTGNTTIGGNLVVNGTGNSTFAGNVGIGTTSTGAALDISNSGFMQIQTTRPDTTGTSVWQQNLYSSSGFGPTFATQMARGTVAAPQALTNGIHYLTLAGNGYDGSSFKRGAQIYFDTSEDWSSTGHGTNIRFYNTPNGETLPVRAMTIYNNGYVGIGDMLTPQSKLDVAGGAAIGTYAGSNPAPTNGLIVSGNIGIGTTAPGSKLQIAGDITPSATSTHDLGSSSLYWNNLYVNNLYGASTGTSGYWQRTGGSIAPTNITDSLNLGSTATASALVHLAGTSGENSFINTGNLGIGTTNPGYNVQIGNGAGSLGIPGSLTANSSYIQLYTQLLANNQNIRNVRSLAIGQDQVSSGNVFSVTGNTNIIGNVGIGTTTPSYKLDVTGSASDYLAQIYNSSTNAAAAGLSIRVDGSGNLLTLNNNGTDIVTISPTQATFNTPTAFTSAGDVSIAYDLNFTNPTASYIKSAAPLYIQAGETYNSSNLTLATYNTGNVVIDSQALVANQAASISGQLSIGTLTPDSSSIGNFYLTNSATFGKALAILNQTEDQDIFTASASGSTKFVINKDGNVGIGMANPGYKLTVDGAIAAQTVSGTGDAFIIGDDGKLVDINVANTVALYGNTDNTVAAFRLGSSANTVITSIANAHSYFNNGGNIGIGTTSPNNKLEISSTNENMFRLSNSSGNTIAGFLPNDSTGVAQINFGTSANADAGRIRYQNSDGSLSLYTNDLTRLFIKSDGNVGIGTTSPLGKLNIEGAATGKALAILNETGDQDIFTASASGTTKFVIARDGNVGIGTTAPSQKLTVNGTVRANGLVAHNGSGLNLISYSSGTVEIGSGNSLYDNITFLPGTSEAMRITDTGNIGIGTTDPSSFKLQIAGNIGPSVTNSYDLGSSSLQWNNIYAQNFYAASTGTAGYFQRANGAVAPTNITDDLLLGSTATSSAKFAFINNSTQNPRFTIGNGVGLGNLTLQEVLNANNGYKRNLIGSNLYWDQSNNYWVAQNIGANDFTALIHENGGDLGFYSAASTGSAQFTMSTAELANYRRMTLANNGNLGIGTTSPAERLHLYDASNANLQLETGANATSMFKMLEYDAGSSEYGGFLKLDGAANTFAIGYKVDTTEYPSIYLSETDPGNVGIGTSNAYTKLYVANSNSTAPTIAWGDVSTPVGVLNYSGSNPILRPYANTASLLFQTGSSATRMTIDSSGNVGIGTTNPSSAKLQVSGRGYFTDRLGVGKSSPNAMLHVESTLGAKFAASASYNSIGFVSINHDGTGVGPALYTTNESATGSCNTTVDGAFFSCARSGTYAGIFTGGNVGIGVTNPAYALELPNNADVTGQGRANAWKTYSSIRYKTNIEQISNPLEKIEQLQGIFFDWKPENGGRRDMGFIAEAVGKVIPEIVDWEEDGSGYAKSMAYDRLTALLIEGVKAQQDQIRTLQAATQGTALSSTGNLVYDTPSDTYMVLDDAGNMINNTVALDTATIANIETGNLKAGDVTSSTLTAESGTFAELFATFFKADSLSVNNNLSAGNLTTNGIEYADFRIRQTDDKLTFETKEASASPLLSLDKDGNASFAGELNASKVTASAGSFDELRVKTLMVDEIRGLTASAAAFFNLGEGIEVDFAEFDFAKVKTDLTVLGTTTLADTYMTSLTVGDDLEIGSSSINTITNELAIQPLKQAAISLMGGEVRIETDGTLKVAQNAEFAKDVKVGGNLTADKINVANKSITALSNTEVIASGSAGVIKLKANTDHITIYNEKVTEKSLIFITPKTKTSQALYIKEQIATDHFTVGIPITENKDIEFNFLIVN